MFCPVCDAVEAQSMISLTRSADHPGKINDHPPTTGQTGAYWVDDHPDNRAKDPVMGGQSPGQTIFAPGQCPDSVHPLSG